MISQFQVGTFKVAFPKDTKEQNEIISFLEKRIGDIDTLIKNHQTQISHLQEIRKIEIYNAVTGKVKVT